MVDFANSSTWDISRYSGSDSIVHSPLPLVEMRVMDIGLDEPTSPGESGVALCAPHLVASFNLEDPRRAFRTWFGVSAQ